MMYRNITFRMVDDEIYIKSATGIGNNILLFFKQSIPHFAIHIFGC